LKRVYDKLAEYSIFLPKRRKDTKLAGTTR
jgi:hypothetical protein